MYNQIVTGIAHLQFTNLWLVALYSIVSFFVPILAPKNFHRAIINLGVNFLLAVIPFGAFLLSEESASGGLGILFLLVVLALGLGFTLVVFFIQVFLAYRQEKKFLPVGGSLGKLQKTT